MASENRKLLVSVFNPQEAREAILGGGRIIDSEDPRSALGNIKPRQIMTISDAVLNYKRNLEVQLSTNIGEDQLLFKRSQSGQAIEKSPYEIAGKASQAAIGVACAMGTRVHPCNLVKVGLDGMPVDALREVLTEVVLTLKRTEQFCHCQVMSVLFVQDVKEWNARKNEPEVRKELVGLREFYLVDPKAKDPDPRQFPGSFDLRDYAVGTLRDRDGQVLFKKGEKVTLKKLVEAGVLPDDSHNTLIALNHLFDHRQFFPGLETSGRTTKAVIKVMVDATAAAGADAIMLDTSILSKVARICSVDTASEGLVDLNRFDTHATNPKLTWKGILSLDEIRFFVDYCHFRGVEANLAGSVRSYQAQQIWELVPHLDQASTRGSASAPPRDPSGTPDDMGDTRQFNVIRRELVQGISPPEQGGVLTLPEALLQEERAKVAIAQCRDLIDRARAARAAGPIRILAVNRSGDTRPMDALPQHG